MVTDEMIEAGVRGFEHVRDQGYTDLDDCICGALEFAERAAWIKAEDLPRHLEGKPAWLWSPGTKPTIGYSPSRYSREPHHCGGLMIVPLAVPEPPA